MSVINKTELVEGQMGEPPSSTKVKEPTVGGWLAKDRRKAPETFLQRSFVDLGTDDLPKSRYLSREFHDAEMKRMWPRAWQMACHESEIPEIGDHTVYEIGDLSFIIARVAKDEIKAYRNACLHRGMQLVEKPGNSPAFRCPFHGWTWNLDGTMRRLPEEWDFPQVDKSKKCLPEAKVGTWDSFVFINPDPNAESFEKYMGEFPEHFKTVPFKNRQIAVHCARVMPANWKVSQEAFIESYHVFPTHPEVVPVCEYAETQYDLYPDNPNMSRMLTISVSQPSSKTRDMSPQELANYVAKSTGREPIVVPEGLSFREALADHRRAEVGKTMGESVDHLTDVEMLDAVEYFLFPNFLPWHGFGLQIVYRFRPNGNDHETSIMEVYVLSARDLSKPTPKAPETIWVRPDQKFCDIPQLGRLGPIFDQDFRNISGVQKGMKASAREGVTLARYQESRIRQYHKRIDDFISS